jgi:hypothetical protein
VVDAQDLHSIFLHRVAFWLPRDFGLIGAVALLMTFLVIVRNLGLTNITVQRPALSHQDITGARGFHSLRSHGRTIRRLVR